MSVQRQVSLSQSTSSAVRVGRPSIVSKFPDTVNIAADFVKANGLSAQECSREEARKVGVSIA